MPRNIFQRYLKISRGYGKIGIYALLRKTLLITIILFVFHVKWFRRHINANVSDTEK